MGRAAAEDDGIVPAQLDSLHLVDGRDFAILHHHETKSTEIVTDLSSPLM
jgi:hypothetical protein